MRGLVLFLRSLLFYLVYLTTLVLYAVFCLLVGPFLPLLTRFKVFTRWNVFTIWWLGLSCGIRTEVRGLENVPEDEAYVLLSNHQSPWETIYLYYKFLPISSILKRELLFIPLFGWALALLKPIGIDRRKKIRARKMLLEQGRETLARGISIMIFPEGTRVDPGDSRPFSAGGAALAIENGVKILPVAHNAGEHWPARRFLKYPGTIHVVIGEPLTPDTRSAKELTARVEGWIQSQQKALSKR